MKRNLLALLVLLAACARPQPPAAQPPVLPPVQQPKFAPKLLGAAEIRFDSGAKTAVVSFARASVGTAFVPETTLKFTPSSFTTVDTSNSLRFLNATFAVSNLGAAALNNLTLVAYYRKKPGAENVNGSAFFDIQNFGGGSASADTWALQLRPAHGMISQNSSVVVDNTHADLQIFKPSEIATLQTSAQTAGLINAGGVTGETVLQYGYVARNSSGGRSLAAGSSNNSLTVALRVPQNGDPANTAYRYSMTFLIFEDSITRVTESLDEQAASGAATRASAISATQLEVMCGSSYSGTNPAAVFVPSVKTAGVGSAYSAWMGGNFSIINETPPSISVTGNVPKTFSDSALLGGYQALGGATLSANGFASTDTNLITDNTGSFTFTTQAGKRTSTNFTYKVSDGTCTSPAQPATANIAGMYWFVNNSGANGSGRFGSPFNTLAGAQTAAQAGDVIFVYHGNGSSSGQNSGISLQNNQSLLGEGVGLSVDDVNIAAGTNPVIGNSGGVGVTLAQSNTVQGLQIAGSTFGVSGTNPVSVTLKKLVVSSGSNDGVNIGSSTGSNTITLQNSTLSNSGRYGVYLYSSSSAAVTLSVTGNTFQNNAGLALNTLLQGSGNSTFDLSNNTINNTSTIYGGISIYTQASGSATLYQGRVNNNTVTLNPGTPTNSAGSVGIDLRSLGAGNTRLQVSGNTVTGYDAYGIQAATESTGGARLDLTLSNNNTTYANAGGLAIRGFNLSAGTSGTIGGPSTLCLNMSGNTTTLALPARLQQISGHTFALNGFSGTGTDVNAVQSFVVGLNPAATVIVRPVTTAAFVVVNYSTGTCTAPSF